MRGITGYGLKEAKDVVDDATIGKKPRVIQAVDLARAVASLEWLLQVDGVQARLVEGATEPIALYDFEPPSNDGRVDDDRRLRWAASFGDDPRGAFIRAELAASRAAERLAGLSRVLDATWQVAVGRWWAVQMVLPASLDPDALAPLRARFNLTEPSWEERHLLGRLPHYAMDGLERRAADAVTQVIGEYPGARAEVVRSPSRLAWLLGVERARGASSP